MKYALLGAAGQLGRDLTPRLDGQVIPLGRPECDLSQPETISAALNAHRPDVVINCAAYNFVDRAETEIDDALAVNAWGVRHLGRVCRELNCKLVHVSTDYVFGLDGQRKKPYQPGDAPGPVSVYGLSKLSGEYMARLECPDCLIVRTCGLYGKWGSGGKGGNFVETMLRVAGQGKPLRVVADQFCTPSYTVDVADAIVDLIRRNVTGLHHVTNSGSCSWHELAGAIFELSGMKADLTAIPTSGYPTPARRPGYSVMIDEAVPPLRHWKEALAAYLQERERPRV